MFKILLVIGCLFITEIKGDEMNKRLGSLERRFLTKDIWQARITGIKK